MDFILFLKIVGWIVAVIFGLKSVVVIGSFIYYEFTKAGEIDQLAMRLQGQRIVGYPIWENLVPFAIAVALLFSLH